MNFIDNIRDTWIVYTSVGKRNRFDADHIKAFEYVFLFCCHDGQLIKYIRNCIYIVWCAFRRARVLFTAMCLLLYNLAFCTQASSPSIPENSNLSKLTWQRSKSDYKTVFLWGSQVEQKMVALIWCKSQNLFLHWLNFTCIV